MLAMTSMAMPVTMKDYGIFTPRRSVAMPRGWLIPKAHVDSGRLAAALDRLRIHGVQVQRVTNAAEIPVQRVVIVGVNRVERPFQGHNEVRVTGRYENAQLSATEGALFIPAAQPLARLAFYLLEAESDDGLVTWNVIETGIAVGETYPIYRVIDAGSLRLEGLR